MELERKGSLFGIFDWPLLFSALALSILGLLTMSSFSGTDLFFTHQVLYIAVGLSAFFAVHLIDWRILRRTGVVMSLYGGILGLLVLLTIAGDVIMGAKSWFSFGGFTLQPTEFLKLALVALLAKYFSRRHVEIRAIRHIIVSGLYAFVPFLLVLAQPDFGSAIIVFLIWLGMVLLSGLSKKHLLTLFLVGAVSFTGMWFFGFHDYQKQRITTFLNPTSNLHGDGWNAFQSMVAVGSGEVVGKGIGYGTQSKLRFLPEYQTDFMFAAYAEEWGFVGVIILFALYASLLLRLVYLARFGAGNFETLFTLGVMVWFFAHVVLHVGINMGLLPVTGTTIPFMSYGGSHLLAEFAALGIVSSMRRYGRDAAQQVEFRSGYDVA